MWRLLTLVLVCAGLWGASLALPMTDDERQLRSIVSIAVQQPAGQTDLANSTGAQGNVATVPVNRAYLPEGAQLSATSPEAPALITVDEYAALDVKTLAESTPVASAALDANPPAKIPAVKPLRNIAEALAVAEVATPAPVEIKRPKAKSTKTEQLAQVNQPEAMSPPAKSGVTTVESRKTRGTASIVVAANDVDVAKPAEPALQKLANSVTLAVSPPPIAATPDDKARRNLTRALQRELVRLGCLNSGITGAWDAPTRQAMTEFNAAIKSGLPSDGPDGIALSLAQTRQGRACGSTPGVVVAIAKPSLVTVPAIVTVPVTGVEASTTANTTLAANTAAEAPSVKVDAMPEPVVEELVAKQVAAEASEAAPIKSARRAAAARRVTPVRKAAPRQVVVAEAKVRRPRPQIRQLARSRQLTIARRYPSYQILQASLFRPLVVLRPRAQVQRIRYRPRRALRSWEYTNGSVPGLPKWMR